MLDWSNNLLIALQNNQPYPSLSDAHPEATVKDAYVIQRQFVSALELSELWGQVVGYKAAVTAKQAQQAMGIDAGIMGVLFSHAASSSGCTLQLDKPTLLETEIGFRIAKAITQPVSIDNVADYIGAYMPMIELAAPNLTQRPNAIDLVATNSASFGFIEGAAVKSRISADIDSIQISQHHNDTRAYTVRAGEVMEGQLHALTWLINEVLHQGYKIQPGHLLITGSLGAMLPAKPGNYRAEFAQLEEIEFTVA